MKLVRPHSGCVGTGRACAYQTSSLSGTTPTRHPVLKQAKAEYREIAVYDFTPVSVPLAIALLNLAKCVRLPCSFRTCGQESAVMEQEPRQS